MSPLRHPFPKALALVLLAASLLLLSLFTQTTLASKDQTKKFHDLAASNRGVIELDSPLFDELTAVPRSYGVSVLLTALGSEINCQPCREFDPEYRIVASSFRKTADKDKVLFAVLDFKNGRETFQKLRLNSAPTLYYYPPVESGGSVEPKRFDFTRNGFRAEGFAAALSSFTGLPVPVSRPFNYTALATGVFAFLAVAAVIRVTYSYFSFIIWNKNTWAVASLIIILLMISGHMWNHIRSPPYVVHQNGQISYITHGFSQQLGLESQIVAIVYGVLAFSTASLSSSVPRIPNLGRQRIAVYVWLGCIIVVFSFLMQLFKIKNGGYPFRLLF